MICRAASEMLVSLCWASRGVQLRSYRCSWTLCSPRDEDSAPAMKIKSKVEKSRKRSEELHTNQWYQVQSSVMRGAPRTHVHKNPKRVSGSEPVHLRPNRISPELLRLRTEDFSKGQRGSPNHERSKEAEDTEVLFGVAPCLLALTQRRRTLHKLFVKESIGPDRMSVRQVCEEARKQGVPLQHCSRMQLDSMSARRVHQGLCLEAGPLGFLSDSSNDAQHGATETPLWLVLDGVQDPMNLGAILRSAYFLGVDRIASSIQNSCPLSPVVSKASSGVMEIMEVYGYVNLVDLLKAKVRQGWQVVGTIGVEDNCAAVPILSCMEYQLTSPTLLLIGNEGTGVSPELLELCHCMVTIPAGRELHPAVESLNVSVAAGILLHSLLSSRTMPRH
ncbi:rRNA methyltransferase 1, mitochondrial [Arapaima gigas]